MNTQSNSEALPPTAGSPFLFEVGETYLTQEGKAVKVVARHAKYRGYETVVDADGCHRYDRSTGDKRDSGRVTGTPHDYSCPKNFIRENSQAHGRDSVP